MITHKRAEKMNLTEIGVDIERVERFKDKTLENDAHFLRSIFTDLELEYSFSDSHYAQHLCARFCAKEAVIKTLSNLKNNNVQYKDIEILNNDDGSPFVCLNKYSELKFKISLSHTSEYAIAFVIRIN